MARFEGTDSYVATKDLQVAVNAAIALERPLLVKGEPGTGKTILAHEVARGIGKDLITWHINIWHANYCQADYFGVTGGHDHASQNPKQGWCSCAGPILRSDGGATRHSDFAAADLPS